MTEVVVVKIDFAGERRQGWIEQQLCRMRHDECTESLRLLLMDWGGKFWTAVKAQQKLEKERKFALQEKNESESLLCTAIRRYSACMRLALAVDLL